MVNDVRNTLKKRERLSSKAGLSALFANGRYGNAEGLKFCFKPGNSLPYNRIVVSVPKRCFRRAVKRNLLKRRIREAYRLNKQLLPVQMPCGGTDILFIYSTKDVLEFCTLQESVKTALSYVATKLAASRATAATAKDTFPVSARQDAAGAATDPDNPAEQDAESEG